MKKLVVTMFIFVVSYWGQNPNLIYQVKCDSWKSGDGIISIYKKAGTKMIWIMGISASNVITIEEE